VKKCPCLRISPRHAAVHSFIYIILEKIRNIYVRVVCVLSMPVLLLDSAIAIGVYFSYLVFDEFIVNCY